MVWVHLGFPTDVCPCAAVKQFWSGHLLPTPPPLLDPVIVPIPQNLLFDAMQLLQKPPLGSNKVQPST